MKIYKKGQTIEVGIGEDIHDEEGYSDYIFIDIETITETEVEKLFPMEHILYIDAADNDAQAVKWAKDNPISKYVK